ncbi:two-component system response regulator YesN [Aequitasia blattaphilus]|uniref:Stage 0 sporulation protein A homolog n=1 Tax=Aequitasia blattaphilus TaxID=2949332 RepID=A0ABT1EB47_9FIRM|nr:response regulator [Aequitasia blattaphilus]MCP1103058.1 response regulator [Aequitasia blattaphilus]MCR8615698.1 response regulator [Aequitasia blattaphilus]
MKKISNYNILLVEDEPLILKSLERHINSLETCFKVVGKSSNGVEAIDFLNHENVHVVITDIRMPLMDGLTLAQTIHERFPHILTIIMSGYADFEYARKALKYHVFEYLLKPLNPEELEDCLNKVRVHLDDSFSIEEDVSLGRDTQRIVEYAALYLREHYMEAIDFSTVSINMGFSSAYLTKLFNRYIGESPLKYLTNIRINEAKHLLINTSLPIQKVGEKVGYPDQFHFSKTFRKLTGVNPTCYRKEQTAKNS